MDRYRIHERLGDGTYGSVWRATERQSREMVAIKTLKKKFHSWSECVHLRELESLSKITCSPYIVQLKELIREDDSQLHFVFEFMPDGNLYQLIKKCSVNRAMNSRTCTMHLDLTPQRVQTILFQVLSGLSHMHDHGFIHRDIKPENLLMKGETCKIADFGLTRQKNSYTNSTLTEYISTRWYRAPEVLLRDPYYSHSIDIFAVGCVMAEMISLHPIFPGESEIDQIHRILKLLGVPNDDNWPEGIKLVENYMSLLVLNGNDQSSNCPHSHLYRTRLALNNLFPTSSMETISFMQKLLTLDPLKRPHAKVALQDEYFEAKILPCCSIQPLPERRKSCGGINPGILTPSLEIEKSQKQASSSKDTIPHDVDTTRLISNLERSSTINFFQSPLSYNPYETTISCPDQNLLGQDEFLSCSVTNNPVLKHTESQQLPTFRRRSGRQHFDR